MELYKKIEAILFYRNEPVSIQALSKHIGVGISEVESALDILEERLSDHSIILMRKDNQVRLATSPEASTLIEAMIKEDLSKDLGKAGIETLAIIIYRGPISRSKIDHIRGVNSTFIIRNLLIRGLVERLQDPNDKRGYVYKPSFDLLAHLGVSKVEDLPEYGEIRKEIDDMENTVLSSKDDDVDE